MSWSPDHTAAVGGLSFDSGTYSEASSSRYSRPRPSLSPPGAPPAPKPPRQSRRGAERAAAVDRDPLHVARVALETHRFGETVLQHLKARRREADLITVYDAHAALDDDEWRFDGTLLP